MYLIFKFTNIIEQSSKLSDLAGYTARIGELLEAIDDMEDELGHVTIGNSQQQQPVNSRYTNSAGLFLQPCDTETGHDTFDSDSIEFQDVELSSPNGKTLVSNFNLSINPMDRVVLVGPNGKCFACCIHAMHNVDLFVLQEVVNHPCFVP